MVRSFNWFHSRNVGVDSVRTVGLPKTGRVGSPRSAKKLLIFAVAIATNTRMALFWSRKAATPVLTASNIALTAEVTAEVTAVTVLLMAAMALSKRALSGSSGETAAATTAGPVTIADVAGGLCAS